MKVDGKYIVEIRRFLVNYCNLECNWRGDLSHRRMLEFLSQKSKIISRMNFDRIKTEDILRGNCILVRDEVGQVIPYKNPVGTLCTLEDLKVSKKRLKNIRLKLLNEQGLTYDKDGNIIPIKEKQKSIRRNL